jgi:ABC-2 type transport system permease protein
MSLRRLLAIARKEVLQLSRDRRSLALGFLLPLLLLVLFGYAVSWDVRDVPTAVWDQDRSPASRALLDAFWASGYFEPIATLDDAAGVRAVLDRGEAELVLVVPAGFAADLGRAVGGPAGGSGGAGAAAVSDTSHRPPALVQAIVDGSDANTATIALAYARAIVLGHGARLTLRDALPAAEPGRAGDTATRQALTVASRVWYNEELRSRNMIVPGLVAVIMMIIAAMLTSLTIAREWERGTMEQLAATPVTRLEVVLGKLLPYVAIGLVDVVVITVAAILIFDVPFRGNPALLAVLSLQFLVGACGLGIFVSAGSRSQLTATQVGILVSYLPALLLSGFMFAISAMPAPLRAITYLVPARYFLVVTRGIFLKGVGIEVLRPQAMLMVLFAVAGVALAVRRFKKELG